MQIEQKGSETPRAKPRGCVRRKGLTKARADEQEPHTRCDATRDELAHDSKVLYLSRVRFINEAAVAPKVLILTAGDLPNVETYRVTEVKASKLVVTAVVT